jgi:hypothetical protein
MNKPSIKAEIQRISIRSIDLYDICDEGAPSPLAMLRFPRPHLAVVAWTLDMRRCLLPLLAVSALFPAAPALAQDRGCDIETTSYVRIIPPKAPKSDTVIATPQTPCPVLDTGPQPQIGPFVIDINPPRKRPPPRRAGPSQEP